MRLPPASKVLISVVEFIEKQIDMLTMYFLETDRLVVFLVSKYVN